MATSFKSVGIRISTAWTLANTLIWVVKSDAVNLAKVKNRMSLVNPKSRTLGASLIALVAIAMWGNAMAGMFCPHKTGAGNCVFQQTEVHSKMSTSDASAQMDHMQMDHVQVSDMDTAGSSMEVAEMQMDKAKSSQPELRLLSGEFETDAAQDLESITQLTEPCSHCMMHSKFGERFTVSKATQTNPSYQISEPDTSTASPNIIPAIVTFLELHDHGPPGQSDPLYLLIRTFRI